MTLFTEDGVLDIGNGEIRGRKAIRDVIAKMPNSRTNENGLRPASGRHNISNIVLKVNGNKATGRAYWFHYSNNNPERRGVFSGYGHYEDEMVKVNGQWLFTKRRIYNEGRAEWAHRAVTRPGRARPFGQDFQRHVTFEALVPGAVDDPHAAGADLLDHPVVARTRPIIVIDSRVES